MKERGFDPSAFSACLDAQQGGGHGFASPPASRSLGRTFIALGIVGSTQEEARRFALRGAPHGTVILAEEQVAGRGRRGRTWESPPGAGIWATAILRRSNAPGSSSLLSLAGALAICDASRACGVSAAEIKWPNDLIVRDKKFAGVLGDLIVEGGGETALLGLGVNLDLDRATLTPELSQATTSLRAEGLAPGVGREELLSAILKRLEVAIEEIDAGRNESFLDRFRRLSPSLEGRRVVIEDPPREGAHAAGGPDLPSAKSALRGTTRGIAPDGALLLENDGGAVSVIRYGGTLRFERTTTREDSGSESEAPYAPRR